MKLAVSGYYGFGNIGDEAILEAIRGGFKGHKLLILDKNNRYNIKFLLEADVLISGGGGLLQDATSSKSFLYYAHLIWLAKLLGKKVYIFAQSLGPITNPINKYILEKTLNMADIITVRDEASFDILHSLKTIKPKIAKTSDPSFILDIPEFLGEIKKPAICACPRSFNKMPKDFEDNFARVLDLISEKIKANIYLLPFQEPFDLAVCENIKSKMKSPAKIIKTGRTPSDVLGLLSKMDIIIGARLHSLIFAVKSCVPAIGISYDPKVRSFMNEAGLPAIEPECLKDHFKIFNMAKEMLENSFGIKHSLEMQARKFYSCAMLNFKMLKLLEEDKA